jgi:uncharacterized membrane protein YphA (DoxX/SURF4 family)
VGLILLAARWFVAGIFLRSGIAKATELDTFRSAVANYKLVPKELEKPLAVSLPFAEIVAGVLLAVGLVPVVVAAALAFLLLVFAAAIAINLARGRKFDCGCTSTVTRQTIGWRHVLTDLVLAAAAVAVAVSPPAAAQLWPGPAGPAHAVPSGSALPVLLTVLVCLATMTLLRRALDVRALVGAVNGHQDAFPTLSDPRRH